jgi:hypothetical protein
MPKKAITAEEFINKLREAELLLNQGVKVTEANRKIGASDQTTAAGERNMALKSLSSQRFEDLEKE